MICSTISGVCQSSQTTTTDATLVPNDKLRDAAKLIEKGKVDAARIVLLNEKIDFLNQRIALKDSIIRVYVLKDTATAAVINTYRSEISNLEEQKAIAVQEMKDQNKQYRRQKRKTTFAIIGGIGVTAAALIFLK